MGPTDAEGTEDAARVRLRFEVSDTGIGMANDRLHALFSLFTQMDGSTTRKYGRQPAWAWPSPSS